MSIDSIRKVLETAWADGYSHGATPGTPRPMNPWSRPLGSLWALAVSRNDEWVIDSVYPSEQEANASIPIIGEGRVVPLRFGQTLAGALAGVQS